MTRSYRFYRVCYHLARFFSSLPRRIEIIGRANIPDGPAMICANHSNNTDPFFLAFAFGIGHHLHFIAKIELFKIPVLSWVLRKLGMISVNRGINDISTVKQTLAYLKSGEKVAIFPEGTRAAQDDAVAAKSGALKLAERAGVPLVPVFIPRHKRRFQKIPVVIGEPYLIDRQGGKKTPQEYTALSDELMKKIKALNPEL